MTHTDCWYDSPHHREPSPGHCEEPIVKGALDCQVVLNGCLPSACDQERFKRDMQVMEERLHHCGVLPPVQIGCEPGALPDMRVDPAGTRTDCFGYMHVPDFGFPGPTVIGWQDEDHGCHEAPPVVLRDAEEAAEQALRGVNRVINGPEHRLDPMY